MKKTFLSLLAACFLLGSCKKDNVLNPVNDPNLASGKKLIQTNVNGNITLTYNADGSVKQINTSKPPYEYKKIYSYSPGKVNYISYLGTKKSEIGEYILENGKAISFVWTYYDAFEDPIKTFHESFTYNARGLLEKHKFDNGDYRIHEYDVTGNLLRRTYFNVAGVGQAKIELTYLDKTDKFPWFGNFDAYGNSFFLPPLFKNLPDTYKSSNLLTGQVEYEYSYNYQYDNEGYVTKATCTTIFPSPAAYEWENIFQ